MLACYWAALFIGTHVPVPNFPGLPKDSDKLVHFVMYAGLSYLLALCYLASRPMKLQHYLMVFIITAVYAAADELLQLAVHRHSDLYDGVADALGSLAGLAAFTVTRHILERGSDRTDA
ncbi:MAG: VanZ family protein [Planctomycetaceae bacterium]